MLLVVCALGFGAWTADAVTVNTTTQPLPGSQFQGGDGNQDNPSPNPDKLIDWRGLQAGGQVQHTSDPTDPDNIFGAARS
jgi:hypothetical protein